MGMPILLLAFGGYLGSMLVISRTLRWVIALREARHAHAGGTARRPWFVLAFLHSGPWLLALAIAAVWRVASSERSELLWALVGGISFAAVFTLVFTIRYTTRRKAAQDVPLAPGRLAEKRREFIFLATSWMTLVPTVGIAVTNWSALDRDYGAVILVAVASLPGGWIFALVMWQYFGPMLEVKENKRRQRAERASRA